MDRSSEVEIRSMTGCLPVRSLQSTEGCDFDAEEEFGIFFCAGHVADPQTEVIFPSRKQSVFDNGILLI